MKESNAERFLTAYNNIDYGLRSIYGFKRSMSFSDVVRRSVVLNSVVRKYEDDLIDIVRNQRTMSYKAAIVRFLCTMSHRCVQVG